MIMYPLLRQRNSRLILLGVLAIFCFSCRKAAPPAISFYYWKTRFALDSTEQSALSSNNVTQLYVRYFDIGYNKEAGQAVPLGVIRFPAAVTSTSKLIPVVYIKNEVFKKEYGVRADTLSQQTLRLITQISNAAGQQPAEIQFDCDWTEATSAAYFRFLEVFKQMSHKNISATIRLHQVKYPAVTGVPPVDRGVLMFYNMGRIDAGKGNSIYDGTIAATYLGRLHKYPLKLDIALPVFSWGIQIRSGKVVHLLNKMSMQHFENDTCLQQIGATRFKVVNECFKGGYYLLKNDEVKVERITPGDLKAMATLLNDNIKQPVDRIIFYDLDAFNLNNYETKTYRQIARAFN